MVLGDVEETVTTHDVDEETYEEIIKVSEMFGIDTRSGGEGAGGGVRGWY